jgi:hypothetical protein
MPQMKSALVRFLTPHSITPVFLILAFYANLPYKQAEEYSKRYQILDK